MDGGSGLIRVGDSMEETICIPSPPDYAGWILIGYIDTSKDNRPREMCDDCRQEARWLYYDAQESQSFRWCGVCRVGG